MPRHPSRLAALGLLMLVAACGGGSGGDSDDPPAPAPSPAPGPAPSGVRSTCGLPGFATSLLERINAARAAGANCGSAGTYVPAASLAWNARLTEAADAHSKDMAAKNYFSHTSADGRTLSNRIDATGYAWSRIGENIAAGHDDVDAVMDGWLASPGHCANLLAPGFRHVGVACVPGTSATRYSTYWTMNLAAPR